MAAFEWGLSNWDIDKAAESLNKDLFGDKKMKKRTLVPDSTVGNKDSHGPQDSDDEQFSKKAKKRLKERMRKKKKRAGETVDSSDLNETRTKIESNGKSKSNQTATKENLDEGTTEKKKRKKKNKSALENPSDAVHSGETDKMQTEKGQNKAARKKKKSKESDGKEEKLLLKTTEKQKKRKKPDSEITNEDLTVKKRKISDSAEEKLGESQEKKRKRPNRKKKNNSKKNKYKHLALNSQNKTDAGSGISNGDIKKVSAENESITRTPGSTSQTDKMNISNSSRLADNDSQPETSASHLQKNRDKKKRTKKPKNVVDSPSKEVSENMNQSKCLTPTSKMGNDKERKSNSEKRKENDSFKRQPKIDKQRLLNMLKNSASVSVDQSASSLADGSSLKSNKKKNRKRKRSGSESNGNEQSVAEEPSNSLSDSGSFVVGSLDPAHDKTPAKRLSNTAEELKDKATEKLKAARFRFINEQLYNCKGHEALQLFRKDMEAFKVYHQGFQSQTSRWPVNPLDAIIKHVNKRPKELVVADFGCGDARLSESVPQKVHSFDLVALNDRVTACDMSKTPLADDSIDIAVFCLSLMGTNLNDYILEANRVLKTGGLLKVAEVVSRFQNPDQFIKHVSSLGFLLLNRRELSDMFYLMDFKKVKRLKKSPFNVELKLKPCVYKKR